MSDSSCRGICRTCGSSTTPTGAATATGGDTAGTAPAAAVEESLPVRLVVVAALDPVD